MPKLVAHPNFSAYSFIMVPVIWYLALKTYRPPSTNKHVGYRAQLTELYLAQSIINSTVSVFFKLIFLRYIAVHYIHVSPSFYFYTDVSFARRGPTLVLALYV